MGLFKGPKYKITDNVWYNEKEYEIVAVMKTNKYNKGNFKYELLNEKDKEMVLVEESEIEEKVKNNGLSKNIPNLLKGFSKKPQHNL